MWGGYAFGIKPRLSEPCLPDTKRLHDELLEVIVEYKTM
jgi:hypothetical protein